MCVGMYECVGVCIAHHVRGGPRSTFCVLVLCAHVGVGIELRSWQQTLLPLSLLLSSDSNCSFPAIKEY